MNRSDSYIISLGALYVFLFVRSMSIAQTILLRTQSSSAATYILAGLIGLTVYLIFVGIGQLVSCIGKDDDYTIPRVQSVGRQSILILACLLLLQLTPAVLLR